MCFMASERIFHSFSTFSPYLSRVRYRNVVAAWVGQKWCEKILSHCYIDGAFFLVVQYPIRDLRAKFQLDGEFCLGIGKILTNSTGLLSLVERYI